MVLYEQFLELSQSSDSEVRSQAAHLASLSFVDHNGSVDEYAALYASLISFLEDNSVKVRAALAYGLLHSKHAPRPVILSLLHDVPIISRAVAQYSPILVDADLMGVVKSQDIAMLDCIADRPELTQRVVHALLENNNSDISLKVLWRHDVDIAPNVLARIADDLGDNPKIRDALFARDELPGSSRFLLIEKVCSDLTNSRLVKGAIAQRPLNRLMRDLTNSAITSIGESEACLGLSDYALEMIDKNQVNARILLHSVVSGDVLFFAQCVAVLTNIPQEKIFTLLNSGSRASLNALFSKSGMNMAIRNLLARLIFYARSVDLADDLSARHLVVTCLINELLDEHDGNIAPELEDAFSYLNEQNILLARSAAAGVMPAFATGEKSNKQLPLPLNESEQALALPAA